MLSSLQVFFLPRTVFFLLFNKASSILAIEFSFKQGLTLILTIIFFHAIGCYQTPGLWLALMIFLQFKEMFWHKQTALINPLKLITHYKLWSHTLQNIFSCHRRPPWLQETKSWTALLRSWSTFRSRGSNFWRGKKSSAYSRSWGIALNLSKQVKLLQENFAIFMLQMLERYLHPSILEPPLWANSLCFKDTSASKQQEIDSIDVQLSKLMARAAELKENIESLDVPKEKSKVEGETDFTEGKLDWPLTGFSSLLEASLPSAPTAPEGPAAVSVFFVEPPPTFPGKTTNPHEFGLFAVLWKNSKAERTFECCKVYLWSFFFVML